MSPSNNRERPSQASNVERRSEVNEAPRNISSSGADKALAKCKQRPVQKPRLECRDPSESRNGRAHTRNKPPLLSLPPLSQSVLSRYRCGQHDMLRTEQLRISQNYVRWVVRCVAAGSCQKSALRLRRTRYRRTSRPKLAPSSRMSERQGRPGNSRKARTTSLGYS